MNLRAARSRKWEEKLKMGIMPNALVICFLRPPHPRDIRGLCRAIAGELLQLCDDFMPRPPGTLPQICLT